MISLENYGWLLECKWSYSNLICLDVFLTVSPAFYAAGMLSGLNASLSFRKLYQDLVHLKYTSRFPPFSWWCRSCLGNQ